MKSLVHLLEVKWGFYIWKEHYYQDVSLKRLKLLKMSGFVSNVDSYAQVIKLSKNIFRYLCQLSMLSGEQAYMSSSKILQKELNDV